MIDPWVKSDLKLVAQEKHWKIGFLKYFFENNLISWDEGQTFLKPFKNSKEVSPNTIRSSHRIDSSWYTYDKY